MASRSPNSEQFSSDDLFHDIQPLALFRQHSRQSPAPKLISFDDSPETSSAADDSTESETSVWSSETEQTAEERLLSSVSVIQSSPCIGPNAAAHRIRKGRKKRTLTIASQKNMKEEKERKQKREKLDMILDSLHAHDLGVWDFMEYIFHPKSKKRSIQWQEFFLMKANVRTLLDWWSSSKNSRAGRQIVHEWIQDYVRKVIAHKARRVTKHGHLRTMDKKIDSQFAASFTFSRLHDMLVKEAPVSMLFLKSMTTSPYAETRHSKRRQERTKTVITSTALACLGEYSHANNLSKRMIALYMYATGAQRQSMAVLSTLGICESYGNLTSKSPKRKRNTKKNQPSEAISSEDALPTGTLHQLSRCMRTETRQIATTGLYETAYDNVNADLQIAEDIVGRHNTQENGTCATVIPLFNAKEEDLNVKILQETFLNAPTLAINDIVHSKDEQRMFKSCLEFTILRIIVKQGGPGFERFKPDLNKAQPETSMKIQTHKSTLHPLPAWPIDESSITGNAEVIEAIHKELQLENVPHSAERVQFLAGDQLSIARLRALEGLQAGHKSGLNSLFWGAWIPGLFHAKIADAVGTLLTHFGKPDTASRDPNSLWYHNTRLNRLPITLTSLPTFRKCRDLLFVSLYARVLHCLLIVSKCRNLEEYLIKYGKWEQLVTHAKMIFSEFADSSRVELLRTTEGMGDMVLENAILFMRDVLISREFTDAIKAGDSGRVILVLKVWAFSYRGNGRTKYAYEMLHLIHSLEKVWPKPIRDIILKNWLLNPTGNENSFVEVDLAQEHLNYWIKTAYKAHGSNASWEWMDTLAPTIEVLRGIARNLNDAIGANQGSRHAPPDLTNDISCLMESLEEHGVYRYTKGRVLGEDTGGAVKDVISAGMHSLTEGKKTPLTDYNKAFQKLQERRRLRPVADQAQDLQPPPLTSTPPETKPDMHSLQPPYSTSNGTVSIVQNDLDKDLDVQRVDDEEADEEPTEFAQVLDDIESGNSDLTLPRISEEDVALDMDEVLVDEEDEDFSDDDEDE